MLICGATHAESWPVIQHESWPCAAPLAGRQHGLARLTKQNTRSPGVCSSQNGQFEWLADRIGRQKAIVAIARKLLVSIWHVLTARVADRKAQPQQVARYFIPWGRQLRVKTTLGLKASQFARQQLDRLKPGRELERVPYGSVTYCLPPATTTT